MAARAIWKGVIQFGSVKVPVKLYSAVEDTSVHFRLLRREQEGAVHQNMVNPESDEPVPYQEAQKGFAVEGGSYVILRKDELAAIEPKPSRDIDVTSFVPPSEVSPEWYLRPYYLGPDGDDDAYFALKDALIEEGKEGIARWVMRGTEYAGVLRPEGDYLMLITMRRAEEVVASSELPRPEGRAHNDKEARMAEQLIAMYEGEFEPEQYHDEYRQRVLELIEAKAQGKPLKLKRAVTKAPEKDLTDALSRSLKQARKGHRAA